MLHKSLERKHGHILYDRTGIDDPKERKQS